MTCDILRSTTKWTGIGGTNSDDHYLHYGEEHKSMESDNLWSLKSNAVLDPI